MSKRVLVVGLGRFGSAIADTLWTSGAEVVVIDRSAEAVDARKDRSTAAYVGDAVDVRTLASIGAAEMDVAIVTFGEDFESTILASASLVRMGTKQVIARAATERQAEILRAVGVARVVQVEQELGRRVASEVTSSVAADIADFAAGLRTAPWVVHGPAAVGRTLAELDLRRRYEVNVVGLWRKSIGPTVGTTRVMEVAHPDYRLGDGDTLLLVGQAASVDNFLAAHK